MVSSEVLLAFIGDNAFQVDAAQAEAAAREKYPLLFHPNETVEMAFKAGGGIGRDKSYLTTHRLLIKDGKGIGSKRKNYLSIPYDTIQAFSIQSAGMWDGDIELKVWTAGSFTHRIDFAKGQLDLFAIQAYMNSKSKRGSLCCTEYSATCLGLLTHLDSFIPLPLSFPFSQHVW
jgi:hypothetical protein